MMERKFQEENFGLFGVPAAFDGFIACF